MKDLKDLLNESILDVDKDHRILCMLQKPKFNFVYKGESGGAEWQYGEIHGEKDDVIGLYEFYDSTHPSVLLIVDDSTYDLWSDWNGEVSHAQDYIYNQCIKHCSKLFGINLEEDDVYVWNVSDYISNIEGGAVPFEGNEFDQGILDQWIKWLKFFNKTVKKLSKNPHDLVRDVSEKTWKTYF
jgi:hypothetical protein